MRFVVYECGNWILSSWGSKGSVNVVEDREQTLAWARRWCIYKSAPQPHSVVTPRVHYKWMAHKGIVAFAVNALSLESSEVLISQTLPSRSFTQRLQLMGLIHENPGSQTLLRADKGVVLQCLYLLLALMIRCTLIS